MGLFDKIFGTYSERELKRIEPIKNQVLALEDKYKQYTDSQLRAETDRFKSELASGKTLDDIMPEALAVCREAGARVLGKRAFPVQIIGAIVLHQGRIAEMKTGEGKTLTACLASYLNALSGKGVHVVTVNDYLAKFQSEEMGRVYRFLGLSIGVILHSKNNAERREAYNCDITYGTNNEFGFDYLRDNRVVYKKDKVQRGHAFAIVDEVDSILIDEARTPLIISGQGEESSDMYMKADRFAKSLKKDVVVELETKQDTDAIYSGDYIVDEKAKTATLTKAGVSRAEAYFGVENLMDADNVTLLHHINQAIKANGVMKKDIDYVVKDGEVIIVDEFTGRLMYGRRYNAGLHQAIEAKEGVKIANESKTIATITFQNYFRLYEKLSGMTGTAATEENEFREIYKLDVVVIPTNKPMIRVDHPDVVYKTEKGKIEAVIDEIVRCHEKGQPVLVGTISIEKSELLSAMLRRRKIEHQVLNAKYHEKEAQIVAQAGQYGAVTIATNMAGRGTDIMLGGNPEFMAKQDMLKQGYDEDVVGLAIGSSTSVSEEVLAARKVFRELFDRYKREIEPEAEKIKAAGGLFIIGTERHESRRIDNQLRGRSGRQGDPGESRFFLSLDDDLMRLFGSERILGMVERLGLEDDQPIEARILSNSIENAQKQLEDNNFARRKNVLSYDDVMNQQRTVIYKQRREVLDGCDLHDKMTDMITTVVDDEVNLCVNPEAPNDWKFDELRNYFLGTLCSDGDFRYTDEELSNVVPDDIKEELEKRAEALYAEKEKIFGTEQMREIERVLLLRNVDEKWMDHLEAMEDLKGSVGLNAYAQRNPISEYRIAAADMFDAMIASIREDTVRMLLSVQPRRQEIKRVEVAKVTGASFEGAGPIKKKPVVLKKAQKVGRNDPCPCGSGKKYKKCCGINDSSAE